MNKIQFDTSTISLPEIIEFFEEYMIVSKSTPAGNGSIALGALTFYPDGVMSTEVSLKNIVLSTILEDFRKAGHEFEFI